MSTFFFLTNNKLLEVDFESLDIFHLRLIFSNHLVHENLLEVILVHIQPSSLDIENMVLDVREPE